MKKSLSFFAVFMLFASINISAANTKVNNEYELLNEYEFLTESCFSFYHGIFDEYYGGVTIDNVADFNYLVAQCQAAFE